MSETTFLTGFPGFIATRLLRRLAGDRGRFFLLVQPAFHDLAVREIAEIAKLTDRDVRDFQIVEGDITKPDLGVSPDNLSRVRAETSVVFHLAAIYDLAVARDI